MFRMQKEKYFVDYGGGRGQWTEKDVLIRDDGFKVMRIGGAGQMRSQYRYTNRGLSFDFYASRHDEGLNPIDTWTVDLGLALKFLGQNGTAISLEAMHEIAQNIEAALLSWPPSVTARDVSVKSVRFRMTPWPLWNQVGGQYYER